MMVDKQQHDDLSSSATAAVMALDDGQNSPDKGTAESTPSDRTPSEGPPAEGPQDENLSPRQRAKRNSGSATDAEVSGSAFVGWGGGTPMKKWFSKRTFGGKSSKDDASEPAEYSPHNVSTSCGTESDAMSPYAEGISASNGTSSPTPMNDKLHLDFRGKTSRGGLTPVDASTTCSEDPPLSPIAESGDTLTRIVSAFGWSPKRSKDKSHREPIVEDIPQRAPLKHSKSKFSFWGSKKTKTSDQLVLQRNIGGGSKANIDAVFLELKSTAWVREDGSASKPSQVHQNRISSLVDSSRASSAEESGTRSTAAGPTQPTSTVLESLPSNDRQHSPSMMKTLASLVGNKAGASASNTKPAKIPRLEVENQKDWIVEYYKDHKETLKIEACTIVQNLQVRSCENVTLQVTKKLNNVIIESCKKTNVILAGLISSIELVHCDRVKVQVIGKCPSVNMDNCAGITLYVGKEGKDVTVTSSKSSDMNISFPVDDKEEDWIEVPIPQQFVHTINEKDQVESRVSDLYR